MKKGRLILNYESNVKTLFKGHLVNEYLLALNEYFSRYVEYFNRADEYKIK